VLEKKERRLTKYKKVQKNSAKDVDLLDLVDALLLFLLLILQSLAETPGRVCLHEGSLLELDPIDGTPLKRIHAYLFNDVLMVASWLANGGRRGPPRYKMQAVYNLESLAIVNVRDHGTVKLAFKLLAFSDTRVFQCATATSKVSVFENNDRESKGYYLNLLTL